MILSSLKSTIVKFITIISLFFCFQTTAFAHATGQSYIFVQVNEHTLSGRFEITFADANTVLGLSGDSVLTAENLPEYIPLLQAYYKQNVSFGIKGKNQAIRFSNYDVLVVKNLADYVQLNFKLLENQEKEPDAVDVDYNVMFDLDNDHQAFLVIEHYWKANFFNNEATISLVFSDDDRKKTLDLANYSMFTGFLGVVKMGIKHILIGIDHILFIIALLLPSVMVRREKVWEPVGSFKPALFHVIKIITLFTIAHSVTLSLAALDIFDLPSRFVESIIAVSIAIAALDILYPIFHNRIGWVVFGFGLFHGFGFASVLKHLGVLSENLALSLFGFNLGVEIGQVAVIVLAFPILFLIRKLAFYKPVFLKIGAVLLILIAMYWFIERAFAL